MSTRNVYHVPAPNGETLVYRSSRPGITHAIVVEVTAEGTGLPLGHCYVLSTFTTEEKARAARAKMRRNHPGVNAGRIVHHVAELHLHELATR
jgi:hypothetical protein